MPWSDLITAVHERLSVLDAEDDCLIVLARERRAALRRLTDRERVELLLPVARGPQSPPLPPSLDRARVRVEGDTLLCWTLPVDTPPGDLIDFVETVAQALSWALRADALASFAD